MSGREAEERAPHSSGSEQGKEVIPVAIGSQRVYRFRLILRATKPWTIPPNPAAIFHALIASANGLKNQGDAVPEGLIVELVERGVVALEVGERYVLGLTWFGRRSSQVRDKLLSLLAGLRQMGSMANVRNHPLCGNFEVVEALDLVGRKHVTPTSEIACLKTRGLEADLDALESLDCITLNFESPLRLQRPRADRQKGAGHFDTNYFQPSPFLIALERRLSSLDLSTPNDQVPVIAALERSLAWLDMSYGRSPRRKQIGGAIGRVVIERPPRDWLLLLLMGQVLHVGSATAFGYGRYRVLESTWDIASCHALEMPLTRLLNRCDLDQVSWNEGLEAGVLGSAILRIRESQYLPNPARIVKVQIDDRERTLMLPDACDRAIQRMIGAGIAPYLDALFENSSFAYRKGLNTRNAAFAVRKAYRGGYRYAWKLDFQQYFDSIDHNVLAGLLDLYLQDQDLSALLMSWVRCGTEGRGLPLGAPISPILANLFLDKFDEAVEARGHRLVRYADDFVILFRKSEEAEAVLEQARSTAEAFLCKLNEEKTTWIDFSRPFSFLGFRFECHGTWQLDPTGARVEHVDDLGWKQPSQRQESKLCLLPGETTESSPRGDAIAIIGPEVAEIQVSETGKLKCRYRDDDIIKEVDVRGLRQVMLLGAIEFNSETVKRLIRTRIEVLSLSRTGSMRFSWRKQANARADLILAQARALDDKSLRLDVSRDLIAAKIHNYAALSDTTARSKSRRGLGDELRNLSKRSRATKSLAELRGVEGAAARLWYRDFQTRLHSEHRFLGRHAPSARDPINVMLNLAQTLLHEAIIAAIEAQGLEPSLGILHEARSGHAALASDLQEPFRHLADRAVIVATREVGRGAFREGTAEDAFPLMFQDHSRRRFIQAFLGSLNRNCLAQGRSDAVSFRHLIHWQARSLKGLLLDGESVLRSFRHP